MPERVMNIGIMDREQYRQRTIAIARGEYIPRDDEPKVWFESLQSVAQILSNDNQRLLKLIMELQPQSLRELEQLSGRSASNLSRTLKTMARYGFVEIERDKQRIIPRVVASEFKVEFGLAPQHQGNQ